jgi:hypothetical protein
MVPSTDLENTNPASLNYSLRAGTTPRGVNLVSPPANGANGYRRLVERGSLNTTSWLIRDVPRGTYYWSVQSIDSSFAGSPFSPEATFTITNARPFISTVPTNSPFRVARRPPCPLPLRLRNARFQSSPHRHFIR